MSKRSISEVNINSHYETDFKIPRLDQDLLEDLSEDFDGILEILDQLDLEQYENFPVGHVIDFVDLTMDENDEMEL